MFKKASRFKSFVCVPIIVGAKVYASNNGLTEIPQVKKVNKEISMTAKTSFGKWDVNLAWISIDVGIEYWEVIRGIVTFKPKTRTPQCSSISFIQTAKVIDNDGLDYVWPLAESPRNKIKTSPGFGKDGGFYVDHKASACSEGEICSPYYRDHWPNLEDDSRDGYKYGNDSRSAVLVDYPFGWEYISSIRLEACAYCRDDNKPMSCFQWGGKWALTGEPEFLIEGPIEKPTFEFQEALEKFENYYQPLSRNR